MLHDHDDHDETCDCIGGHREVTIMFARQEAGIATDELLEQVEQKAVAAGRRWSEWHASRSRDRGPEPSLADADRWAIFAAALNTVYPCPRCRADQYERWRNGCFRLHHRRGSCRLCSPSKQEARR